VASLIGHNDVRKAVMGRANRDATPDEMKKWKRW
jgi:N-acyl-D-amino-acid deacylase